MWTSSHSQSDDLISSCNSNYVARRHSRRLRARRINQRREGGAARAERWHPKGRLSGSAQGSSVTNRRLIELVAPPPLSATRQPSRSLGPYHEGTKTPGNDHRSLPNLLPHLYHPVVERLLFCLRSRSNHSISTECRPTCCQDTLYELLAARRSKRTCSWGNVAKHSQCVGESSLASRWYDRLNDVNAFQALG